MQAASTSTSNRSNCSQQPIYTSDSSSHRSSSSLAQAVFVRGFRTGVVDVQKQQQQQQRHRKGFLPYFNPDDGPEAYRYWEDLWRRENPRRKRQIPKRETVYLEEDQQLALCEAAVEAGIPRELVYGDTSKFELPRLIHFMHVFSPKYRGVRDSGIPTTPESLSERIQQFQQLEGIVPGLDFTRIYQTHGFGVLSVRLDHLKERLQDLQKALQAANVSAEVGLVFTAQPKAAFFSQRQVAERAKRLPELFKSSTGGEAPASLLTHPYQAKLLGYSSNTVAKRINKLSKSLGEDTTSRLLSKLPQLLQTRPASLQLKVAALAAALPDKSMEVAQQLVHKEPRLLTCSAEKLQQRVQDLTQLLNLSPEEVHTVLVKRPSLLTKATDTIKGKLQRIQQVYNVSEEQAAQMAKQNPQLLCYSLDKISGQQQKQLHPQQQQQQSLSPAESAT